MQLGTRWTATIVILSCFVVLAAHKSAEAIKLKGRNVAIYVDNMHCKTCAKKIARKLYAVPGVVAVHADVKQNVAVITPQNGKDPAPKAIWEAVESAKFKPVKLIGPYGTFQSKPKG